MATSRQPSPSKLGKPNSLNKLLPKRLPPLLIKTLVPILVMTLLILGGLYVIKSQLIRTEPSSNSAEIGLGRTLPDLKLTRLDGSKALFSELQSGSASHTPVKIMMLTFWATWCDACMEEMPSIVRLRDQYQSRGFEVLGINLDENPEIVALKSAKKMQIQFPIFKDPDGVISEFFDVHAIPLTLILDQHRKILQIKDGQFEWDSPEMRAQLERWLTQ